ncbi:two-component system, chemotaxis family, response regulator CheV [Lachnospiraceae bacterium KH1T2]|nr:two-component system, chemotaxis family, response regulator CheV [Lachnospiraceae bacterium KH1T2]
METNILLENGTNELEILEFKLDGESYGINVAKIKEIIPFQPVTPVPNSHPSIEGIFMPRDTMITAINLKNCLQRGNQDEKGLFIITNFNKLDIAFHVDAVVGIHRVSWGAIIKPDATVNTVESGVSTGIVKFDSRLVIILDFEKIVTDISPETGLKVTQVEDRGTRRSDVQIVLAEDSALLHKLISDSLKKSGYTRLIDCVNGQEAWNFVTKCRDEGTLDQKVGLVITDIEMPIMDGHHLTKLIKSDDTTKHVPVIIFSSLVNEEMKRKGEQLGADAQLSKPEIGNLVRAIDDLLEKKANGLLREA